MPRLSAIPLTVLLLAGLTTADEVGAPPNSTGPWDVQRILSTRTQFEVDVREGSLRAIRYRSELYLGHETEVFAYYAVPESGSGPFPAMLLVHGGGGKAFAEWAQLWADRGYVALAMDLAGNGADGKRLAHGGPPQDDDTKFEATETNSIQDTWPYQAVAAVLRGHALLLQQPQVDKSRIGITGISWGGYLTCIVAGIDHRLAVAVPVYGCGFLGDNSAWKESGRFDRLSSRARNRWLKNFDPSQYLAGVKCPILFVNGTNDFAYPLDSYQKSYRLVTSPRNLCITVKMPHGHQAGWAPPEIAAFVDSVLKDGKSLATLSPVTVDANRAVARFSSAVPLASAKLHCTTDAGRWQERSWTTLPAEIDQAKHELSANLPTTRPLICFFTSRDDRGLTVSTEHLEIAR